MPISAAQHAECCLVQRFCDRELIHLFIVTLLQADDLALGRAGDKDHRKAVGGGVGERGQAIEEAGRRHGEANAGLLGQKPAIAAA
jgi:hypothetical protein